MDTKTFKGNFFEIGQQQGKIYKTNGMNFDKIKIDPVLYKNQLQVYQKHYPELLEELSGIAQGGHYDGKKLIYCARSTWWPSFCPSRSLWGAGETFSTAKHLVYRRTYHGSSTSPRQAGQLLFCMKVFFTPLFCTNPFGTSRCFMWSGEF